MNNVLASGTVAHIETLNLNIARFWKEAHGWAPLEAAGLLDKSRLDWQVSLSSSLRLWLREPLDLISDGELILAWTNLGGGSQASIDRSSSIPRPSAKRAK